MVALRITWLKPLLLKHGYARLKLAATHVVVCGLERGMWGYGGKRDEIPMNDAAGAEAEL